MAWRNTALDVPSGAMIYSSGKESTKLTNSGVRNGTRLSIENAIELRSS